jgi:hypothetical protein
MDAYTTLGVSRGCTREEVKEAFRVRVPFAHPDRGGDDLTFIQLRASYEQIMAELDQASNPRAHRPTPGPRDDRTKWPLDSDGHLSGFLDPDRARQEHVAWLRRIAAEAARRDPWRRWKWARLLGPIFLLYLLLLLPMAGLWAVAAAFIGAENYTRPDGWDQNYLEIGFFIAFNLSVLIPSWWLVWKYGAG